jgi:uncharacterized membrane protein
MSIKGLGVTLAEAVVTFIGSWTFIILQTLMVTLWIVINIVSYTQHYDPYPFILLNLFFSTEAAYATPLILMASIQQGAKDSDKLSRDLKLDSETNKLMKKLSEDIKIDKISLKDHENMQKDIEIIKNNIEKLKQNANIH